MKSSDKGALFFFITSCLLGAATVFLAITAGAGFEMRLMAGCFIGGIFTSFCAAAYASTKSFRALCYALHSAYLFTLIGVIVWFWIVNPPLG